MYIYIYISNIVVDLDVYIYIYIHTHFYAQMITHMIIYKNRQSALCFFGGSPN